MNKERLITYISRCVEVGITDHSKIIKMIHLIEQSAFARGYKNALEIHKINLPSDEEMAELFSKI